MHFFWKQIMISVCLQVGKYPYYLKQRILGDRGHLSNENAGRLVVQASA